MGDITLTLHPSRHRVDTFLVNELLLPWSLRLSVSARGMAHPQVIGSDNLPVSPAVPGLLDAAGHAALPTPYSHTEGRLLPHDVKAAPVKRCLWAAVTAAQDAPSLAPWLGPAEQHTYGSMPAAAVNKRSNTSTRRMTPWRARSGADKPPQRDQMRREVPPVRAGSGCRRRSSAMTPWRSARRRLTRQTQPGMASCPRQRSNPRRSYAVHRPGSVQPHRASYRRNWRGKQPPSSRTSATCTRFWLLTASAPSETSGAATPRTWPSGGRPCEEPSRWRLRARQASERAGLQQPNAPHSGPRRDVRGSRLLAGTVQKAPGGPSRLPGGPRPPRAPIL